MSITQSLSDIQVMLQYVEGLIKNQNEGQQTEHLSNIGQNTLDIINHIETLTTTLSHMSDDVMIKHEEVLEGNSVLTKESLENLIRKIEDNEIFQKQVHEEIQDIFTKYSESVSKVMSYMTNNKKHQEDIVGKMDEQISDINKSVGDINEKVMSKNDMASIMEEIGNQLHAIVEAGAESDKQNQGMLQTINDNLLATQEMMESSSSELQSIKKLYTESTSRLSVIDTKMDAMTKHVMKED